MKCTACYIIVSIKIRKTEIKKGTGTMESEYQQDTGEYKFTNKTDPRAAMTAVFGGLAELCVLVALCVYSVYTRGSNELWTAAVALALMVYSACGMYYSVKCFSMEEIRLHYPIAGILINGTVFSACFILYFIGIQL